MDLGDVLPFRSAFYNKPVEDGGVLTNATTVTCTVTFPDGDSAAATVTNPSTGQYAADFPTTDASPEGMYVGKWLATFSGGATTSRVEAFDVGRSLVTVDAAVKHLRAAGIIATESDLDYLQWLTFVATNAIEEDLDRVFPPRTIVETHDGGGSIILRKSPVLSVTAVTQNGSSVTDFLPVSSIGVLCRGSDYSPRPFARGWQNITVTYRAGHNNPPAVVRKVALNAIQGMWQSSQQAPHPALAEYNDVDLPSATAALTSLEKRAYDSMRAAAIA